MLPGGNYYCVIYYWLSRMKKAWLNPQSGKTYKVFHAFLK